MLKQSRISMRRVLRDEQGATAIEYGLIAALVAVAIFVGAQALGTSLNTLFNNIAGFLGPITVG